MKKKELNLEDLDQVTGGAGGYPVDLVGAGLGDQSKLRAINGGSTNNTTSDSSSTTSSNGYTDEKGNVFTMVNNVVFVNGKPFC